MNVRAHLLSVVLPAPRKPVMMVTGIFSDIAGERERAQRRRTRVWRAWKTLFGGRRRNVQVFTSSEEHAISTFF